MMLPTIDRNEVYYGLAATSAAVLFLWLAIEYSDLQWIWAVLRHS
jgi:uncharacterized membrane protein YccC